MARYYYGLGGGGSPVAQQLNILGANLRAGLGDIAEDRLARAKFGLAEAQAEYEQPKLELEAEQLRSQQEFRKQPFIPPTSLFGDRKPTMDEAIHVAGHPTRELTEIFGYKPVLTEQGTIKHLEKQTDQGPKILTEGMIQDNPQILRTILSGWTRHDRAVNTERDRLEREKEILSGEMKASGRDTAAEIKRIDARLKALNEAEKDPAIRLQAWQQQEQAQLQIIQLRESRGLPTTANEKELTHIRNQIDEINKQDFEMRKLREEYRLRGQLEEKKAGLGGKTKTTDPSLVTERELGTAEKIAGIEDRILNKPEELTDTDLRNFHNFANTNYVYSRTPGVETGWFDLSRDKPAEVIRYDLPRGMTSKKVQYTADKYGMSIQEVLKKLGVITGEDAS